MKTFKRRFLAALCACMLMLTVLMPTDMSIVFAATSGSCGDNATWSFDASTKTLTISGTGETKKYYPISPSIAPSITKAPWVDYKPNIEKIVVEEGITVLGADSFYECTELTEVSLPSTLTKICGSGFAFRNTDYTLGCFQYCTKLESITLPENLVEIESYVFNGCSALKKIVIPDSVTTIGEYAFFECTDLERVTFGSSLTSLGKNSFRNSGVKKVNWNANLTTIPKEAFLGCKFTVLDIPDTVTTVETHAFKNNTYLMSVKINNSNTTLNGNFCEGSNQSVTVYGHSGSTAQDFVSTYGPGTTYNCDYTFVSIDDCSHENTHTEVIESPTCTETGIGRTICDDCGMIVRESDIPATGHTWGDPVYSVDCTEENGHVYNDYVCSVCGDTKSEVVHQYAREIDPDSIDTSAIGISSLAQALQLVSNYDWSQLSDESVYKWVEGNYEVRVLREADCKTNTYGGELYTCTVDGCSKRELRPITPSHTVSRWTRVQQPTCTVDGSREGQCTECGETVTETLKATGHTYNGETPDDVYDDESDGHTHRVFTCQTCGEQTEEYVHNEWKEGYYTPAGTTYDNCELPGVELDVCNVCGEMRTVQVPARGEHDFYEKSYTEPSCTVRGKRIYSCHNCSYEKTEYVDALGHDYVRVDDDSTDATCTQAGSIKYKCSRCSFTKTDTVAALGHTPKEGTWVVDTAPTCTKTGTGHGVCERCDESYTATIDALGHKYENVETDLTSEGKPGHVLSVPQCIRCNDREAGEVVHKDWAEGYYDVTASTPATCTIGTNEIRRCTICNKIGNVEVESPLGHEWQYSGIITNDMISGGAFSNLGITGSSAIVDRLNQLPIDAEVNDGIITFKGRVTADGVVFFCTHCMSTTTKPIAEVKALWSFDLINTAPNRTAPIVYNKGEEDEYSVETDQSSYLDLNGDGLINGKDWACIKTLTVLEAEAVASAAEQQTEE